MILFDLPTDQHRWVAQSRKQGKDGPFRICEATRVTAHGQIAEIDPVPAGMLAEHGMFEKEFEESCPRVIGGGVAFLEAK